MKHKLCLHGLEVKNQAQLLNLAKRLLPGSTVKVKIKEKYFNDNDMYKYRLTRFTPENTDGIRLYCAWGTLLVSDKLLAIADIIIEFEYQNTEAAEAVDGLLQKLLASKTKFVLEEPDFSQRLDQLRGCFDQKQLAAYDADSAMSLLYCHLPWQVYYVSKLWQEVLSRGPERSLMRQLRVKLRRLRSLLTLCKPLLPEQEAVHWQGVLKASTNRLGDVREYDVELQICSRLQRSREQAEAVLPQLTALLTQLRGTAAAKALRGLRLNRLTLELARLLLWLYSVPAPERVLEQLTQPQQEHDRACGGKVTPQHRYPDGQCVQHLDLQSAVQQAAQTVPKIVHTAYRRVGKAYRCRQEQLARKVEKRQIDELFLILMVYGARAVGGYLGQGLHIKAEGGCAAQYIGAGPRIGDDGVTGALIHNGNAHAGQIGKVSLQLVGLGHGKPRLVEMQADAPAALMQNVPFHYSDAPNNKKASP